MTKTRIALAAAACFTCLPAFADATTDALAAKLDELARQVEALKAEVRQLKAQNEALASQQEGATGGGSIAAGVGSMGGSMGGAAGGSVVDATPVTGVSPQQRANSAIARTSIYGYGEMAYTRPDHDASATEFDLTRAVFGIGYRFNERTRFISEFELEHAVTSAEDSGEFEVEQFYIDHQMVDWANLKAGLILIPHGYINAVHEPPRYFGVYRNFVETAIIPTTEREGGIALYGALGQGLSYDIGLTTSYNLGNWDFASAEGRESPLGAVHQELSKAKAKDLAQYASLSWDGVPGVNLAATLSTGEVGHGQPNVIGNPRFLLWDVRGRYESGPVHLQGLYARGRFTDTGAMNLANAGALSPIPAAFDGWFVEGAYRVWRNGGMSLVPFTRYERYNTAAAYAAQPAGFGTAAAPTETVRTYGFSYFLNPDVVFKVDYQQFQLNKPGNRLNIGLGLQY